MFCDAFVALRNVLVLTTNGLALHIQKLAVDKTDEFVKITRLAYVGESRPASLSG